MSDAGRKRSQKQSILQNALMMHQRGRLAEAELLYREMLELDPDDFDATHLLGVAFVQHGQLAEGEQLIARAIRLDPNDPTALHNRGSVLLTLKRFDEALADYDKAVALKPDYAEAFSGRASALKGLKRYDEALASYDRAITLKPNYAEAFSNRGNTLQDLERFDEALAEYDKAITFEPDYAEAFNNRGACLEKLNRPEEALASYDRAIFLKPSYAEAFANRGNALQNLRRFDLALASYDRAVALRPDYAEAFINRGNALQELKRFDEALADYDNAIALKPDHAEAFTNRGNALQQLKRFDEALAEYDKAIALKPNDAETFANRGNALQGLNRLDLALASYDRAIALKSSNADAFNNRGVCLEKLDLFEQALTSCEQALTIKPDHPYAFGTLARSVLKICDWTRTEKVANELKAHVAQRKSIVPPFISLACSNDAALQLKCAQRFVADQVPTPLRPLWHGRVWRHDKIKIAYLSADFREHPVAHLTAELFERHDRSRFDVLGVSFGRDDKSSMRSRLIKSFDVFEDVRFRSDDDVAKLLHRLEVDIAVDLNGHTRDARIGIFAHRPAPIQVNYLGFPGTTGADFIDYLIADKVVLPFCQQPHYTEKIVHLPECYQVNDSQRPIGNQASGRRQAGLPEHGFVFCCFNNSYKITAPVFDIWMRLLGAINGSVLWLLRDNETAGKNIRGEAAARGVDPERLVFGDRLAHEDHLARHRLADLFLDTLPYNAHTTASDALWVGLPVLTCCGETFAGRVAASILTAGGIPELVTHSLDDYEALALWLARDTSLLAGIRTKLAQNREVCPLFDSRRFARDIEAAYTTMWDIWQCGERPRSFSVVTEQRE
jgi:predicted O-linked N-acetylglucosamine transferase (SPINDLY family)